MMNTNMNTNKALCKQSKQIVTAAKAGSNTMPEATQGGTFRARREELDALDDDTRAEMGNS